MGFIQPCFIRKSTKDLTDKLYRIGNRSGRGYWHSDINTLLVCESDQYRCLDDEWGNAVSLTKKGYINCGINEELFLAIAALRDDSNENQWFVWDDYDDDDDDESDKFKKFDDNANWNWWIFECHKATVGELINHFGR